MEKDHRIYRIITIINEDLTININVYQDLNDVFEYLTKYSLISIDNLQNLINLLAEHAINLQDEILKMISDENLDKESERTKINLINLSNDLKQTIFKDSKIDNKDQFADFFAQTITYSSFLGWLRFCKEGNNLENFKVSNLHLNLQIAKGLVQEVRKSATIDFTVKSSVQAKMRVTIRRLLKKYKYTPDQRPEAVRLIMEQAQLFGEEWAVATAI